MFYVSPSIYSADLLRLADELDRLRGVDTLHFDIDDGNFVRGISFGVELARQAAAYTDIPLDAHIEALDPMQYARPLCDAGFWLVSANVEALPYPALFLSTVRAAGKKAGLALNIKTPVSVLEPYADSLDQVIVLSVESDCEGLPFRPGVLKKVRELRGFLRPDALLWVDGGVSEANLRQIVDAGANGVVVGRAVFGADEPLKAWRRLKALGTQYLSERKV